MLTKAVRHIPSIQHSASLPTLLLSDRERTVVVVGNTNCVGAHEALVVVTNLPPSQIEPVLQRWLTPLVELARRLTRPIEVSMRVQVDNLANLEPVRKAWVEVGKNLWVHAFVYELETSWLRDLRVTKEAHA